MLGAAAALEHAGLVSADPPAMPLLGHPLLVGGYQNMAGGTEGVDVSAPNRQGKKVEWTLPVPCLHLWHTSGAIPTLHPDSPQQIPPPAVAIGRKPRSENLPEAGVRSSLILHPSAFMPAFPAPLFGNRIAPSSRMLRYLPFC